MRYTWSCIAIRGQSLAGVERDPARQGPLSDQPIDGGATSCHAIGIATSSIDASRVRQLDARRIPVDARRAGLYLSDETTIWVGPDSGWTGISALAGAAQRYRGVDRGVDATTQAEASRWVRNATIFQRILRILQEGYGNPIEASKWTGRCRPSFGKRPGIVIGLYRNDGSPVCLEANYAQGRVSCRV
jgi:hypothetical protein